jgi:hypothetical protein
MTLLKPKDSPKKKDPLKALIKKCDIEHAGYIRERDGISGTPFFKCLMCGEVKSRSQMNCCHFIKRRHWATRFSDINCQGGCIHCNKWLGGNDANFRKGLVEKYGEEKIIEMEAQKLSGRKPRLWEAEEILRQIREKRAALA